MLIDGCLILDILGFLNTGSTNAVGGPSQGFLWSELILSPISAIGSAKIAPTVGTYTDTYTLSTSQAWAMKMVAFNGLPTGIIIDNQGVTLATKANELDFEGDITASGTGRKKTIRVTFPTPPVDQLVKVNAADTTADYLDPKIEIVAGTNTIISKVIQNIGGNEKISYVVNATAVNVPGADFTQTTLYPDETVAAGDTMALTKTTFAAATTVLPFGKATADQKGDFVVFGSGISMSTMKVALKRI